MSKKIVRTITIGHGLEQRVKNRANHENKSFSQMMSDMASYYLVQMSKKDEIIPFEVAKKLSDYPELIERIGHHAYEYYNENGKLVPFGEYPAPKAIEILKAIF